MATHPTYDPAASLVRIRDLHRSFTPDAGVLAGVDLDLRAGEVVCLLGRRGSGKSTLLRALARADRDVPGSGTLRLPEIVVELGADSGMLGWRRVLDNVTAGLAYADALTRGRRALAEVGLVGSELAWPGDLDTGERARAAIARALAPDPELLLADEPFRGLDTLTQRDLHRLLRTLTRSRGLAVLFVTNDPHEAITLADRIVTLRDGRIHADVVVRAGDGSAPVGEEYAELRDLLLAELGLGTPTASRRDLGTTSRRETA
jgi:sulfonate transport system ATP-binding protein